MIALVALGGAIGAAARFLIDHWLRPRLADPWSITIINAFGSLLLGLLVGFSVGPTTLTTWGVGFCGALTTWSTLAHEILQVTRSAGIGVATRRLAASVAIGVLAAAIGVGMGRLLGA